MEAISVMLGNSHAVSGRKILKQARIIKVMKHIKDNSDRNTPCFKGKESG